jgi:hypothetical protein
MPPFRRVEDRAAGPAALGVLAPPGRRTFLILRPRSLPWDLLLLGEPDGDAFRELAREEAAAAARDLILALAAWADGGAGAVEVVPTPGGTGRRLRVRAGRFVLALCGREPGRPYRAHDFPDADAAHGARAALTAILNPPPGVEQELYFNTRHFVP